MLMDQSSRDDTLVDVGPPGATLAGAVSRQSSRDKRPKRSARGSSMRGEGKAISERVVDREEIEIIMWTLVDTFTMVRQIHSVLFDEGDEEEEDRDS